MLRPFILALLSLCLFACGAAPTDSTDTVSEAVSPVPTTPLIVRSHMNVRIGTHIPISITDGCINMSVDPNNDVTSIETMGIAACWTPGQPDGDEGFYRFSQPYRIFSDITQAEWNDLKNKLNTPGVQTVSYFSYDFHSTSPNGQFSYDKILTSISFTTVAIP